MKSNDVIGLGNTLMDFLVKIDENNFAEFNLQKGEMHLVEEDKAKEILNKIRNFQFETIPAGSSANTLRGIAFLGGNAILCGKVGDDNHGEIYIQKSQDLGLTTRINIHEKTTGHAVTFITPDAERTFSVYLGAALHLAKEDILEEDIKLSKILHLEGYQIEGPTKETILHAMELAKKHHTLVSIDLADPALIRRNKEFLYELTKNADIIFMNEEEAKEFNLEIQPEKIIIVKLGKEGSLIYHNNEIIKINAFPANAIDTTGAGDSYAAGFLYGYCNGWCLKHSGMLGSLLAAKIVEKIGVKINELDAESIKSIVRNSSS